MKYLWSLLFLAAMLWTWILSNSEAAYSLEDNSRAETNFAKLIVDSVKQTRPQVTDVHFLQLYTEVIDENKLMRAHFKYEIEEPTAKGDVSSQIISGVARLTSQDNGESWVVDVPANVSDEISFKNGSKIIRGEEPIGDDGAAPAEPDLKPVSPNELPEKSE